MRDYKKYYTADIYDPWSVKANLFLERNRTDYRLDSFQNREHRKKDATYRNRKCRIAENIWSDYPQIVIKIGKGKIASRISNMLDDFGKKRYKKPDNHHARYLAKRDIADQLSMID